MFNLMAAKEQSFTTADVPLAMSPERTKTATIVAGLLIALGVAAFAGVRFYRSHHHAPARFETAAVESGTIVSKVTATGALSALVTVTVGTQVSGRLKEIRVDYNSVVKKGDLIAFLDPDLFVANVEQQKATLLMAQAALAKDKVQVFDASRTFKRQQQLQVDNLNAQQDVDTAETTMLADKAQVQADEANIAQAQANLRQAQLNYAYSRIFAPISGVVISKAVDVGQTVAASFQAPTLFTIAQDLTHMQVDTSIAESDVGKLKDKMKATFTVDAYPNDRFVGTIRQIRNASTTTQNVVTYDAVIDVENPDLKLRPGMTANIVIVSMTKDDVLRVPNSALRFKPPVDASPVGHESHEGGHDETAAHKATSKAPGEDLPGMRTVYLLRDGKPRPVRVRIGITDGTNTELAEGPIESGDKVITGLAGAAASTDSRTARMRGPF